MGIAIGTLKPSMAILYNDELYTIVSCEHSKIARGSAFCRAKLRNMKTGQVLERTLRDSDNIEDAFIEKRKLQYTYVDGEIYHFLDLETYEDLVLSKGQIEDVVVWLKDNLELAGLFYANELINLEVPLSLELKIAETTPGFRGDTVKAGTKAAILETGLTIQVPLFIESGETVKVDTRTKGYMGRG